MSDGSVMAVLCSCVSKFSNLDKNVINVKGGIVGNVLGCLFCMSSQNCIQLFEALLLECHCYWDYLGLKCPVATSCQAVGYK